MATEYGKRLLEAMAHAKINQKELIRRTGTTQSTVSSAINRGNGSAYTASFADACGVVALWLESGKGLKFPKDANETADLFNPKSGQKPSDLRVTLDSLRQHLRKVPDKDVVTAMLASLAKDPDNDRVADALYLMLDTAFAQTTIKVA